MLNENINTNELEDNNFISESNNESDSYVNSGSIDDVSREDAELKADDFEDEEILSVIKDKESEERYHPNKMEKLFGNLAKSFMVMANPFKKMAFKTPCLMHRFINIQAVHILENEGYIKVADFYRDHIKALNEGATWIDQDFKSINHFYHHDKEKGLYGFSDALTEAEKYKDKLVFFAGKRNLTRAMFYAGVICHLIQDMTVPQHVNNKLLESHRDYEVWILSKAWDEIDFSVSHGIKRYPRFEMYARENAKNAQRVYAKSKEMEDREEMYKVMATELIAEAQYTTAGLLLDFYENYFSKFSETEAPDYSELRVSKAI